MIRKHVEARGIRDPLVLDALSQVAREAFVPTHFVDQAYDDVALPIGDDKTSQQLVRVTRAQREQDDRAALRRAFHTAHG